MDKLKVWLGKKWVWALIIAVLGGGYYIYRAKNPATAAPQYVQGQAVKGTLTVSVTGTGQVAAENQLDIKPSGSSKIVEVDVQQGQTVKAGQKIVVLDQTGTSNAITQARASLASAKANYDSVVAGATDTDLKLAQSAVDSAQLSLDKAKADYDITKQQQDQAVNKAYTALLNDNTDPVASPGNSTTATLTVSGTYGGTDQGKYVISIYATGGGGMYFNYSGLETGNNGPISTDIPLALGTKGLYVTFGSGTVAAGSTWTVTLPNLTDAAYSTLNNTYQSALLTRQQTMQNAQNTINSDQLSLQNAQTQLQQKQAGSTNAQIEQAAAQVASAEAGLQTALTNYQNNIITAPFDGVIAQLSAKIGDQVNGNTAAAGSTNLATLITKQKIATVSLNEVDVAKIKVGDKATLTFDAIDGLDMTGTVAEVDAIGTVSQGVVTYNVKITLDTDDDRIKPGMSASASIITNAKTDVLMVPSSAVKSGNNGSYVQALDKTGKPYNIIVQTGLSNDTDTEITSGLAEGQTIIVQTITPSTAATTGTTRTGGALGGFGAVRIGGGAGR